MAVLRLAALEPGRAGTPTRRCGTDVEIVEGKHGWSPRGGVLDRGFANALTAGDLVRGIVRRGFYSSR